MSNQLRVVKLLKNRIYPTYQLHAFMANAKTAPRDGLRLAALTTMQWLRNRLGEAFPAEWNDPPAPEEYLNATDDDLPSLYTNQGHVINIVSLPDKGMWTLQITEPDLGSDPGNPNQSRPAVPGRIIETNVAFRISGTQLECGFKTVISDPVGTEPEAEVYRTAVVKLLMENPAFGLKQVTDLPMQPVRLTNNQQVKTMLWVTHHADNPLPAVIFTQPSKGNEPAKEKQPAPSLEKMAQLKYDRFPILSSTLSMGLAKAAKANSSEPDSQEPPYDLKKFSYYTFSFCRTYVLERAAENAFSAQSGLRFKPGDILILYPAAAGVKDRVIPYRAADDRKEVIRSLEKDVKNFLKTCDVDFGSIMFLSGAREHLLRVSDELMESAEAADARFRTDFERLNASWKDVVKEKEQELERSADQLRRQKEYASALEEDKRKLREDFSKERDNLQAQIDAHLATIEFWKRCCDQPWDYDGIEDWVKKHFSDRLVLHQKAVTRMLTRSHQCADVSLVCDALDFLATDYWDMRYLQIPQDTALTRCSEKYGRPFEVKPTSQATINFTPDEYRIRYGKNVQGKEIVRDLDAHLRVGNNSENLLRIYFLHDDERQLIVVGSLPDHLSNVKIQ